MPTNYSQVHDTVLRRQVESAQYTSVAFTQRLLNEGVDPSVGSVGDALDNALAETTVGSFKNELIRRQGPWRDVNHVELGTANGCSGSTPNARTSTSTTSPPRPSRSSTTITDAPHQKRGDSTQPVSGLTGTASEILQRILI